jgi:AraC family transcriptional regulator, positive regulator of tynA and feaB
VQRTASFSAEGWENAAAQAFVPLRVVRMEPGFRGTLVRHEFDDGVWVVEAQAGPHVLARTSRLIDASASDGVVLEIHVDGSTRMTQHGRQAALGAGDGVLFDTRWPYELTLPDANHSLLLHVPRRLLSLRDARLRESVARRADERLTSYALLRGYLRLVLPPATVTADPATRALATRTLVDLTDAVASSLAGSAAATSRELLLSALQVTIRRELGNAELSPALLATRHHVSLRSVHAAFELAGVTPAAHIRALRLERACALLAGSRLRVLDVAAACGFREPSTFVRAFRREHGLTPSEFRARAVPEACTDRLDGGAPAT